MSRKLALTAGAFLFAAYPAAAQQQQEGFSIGLAAATGVSAFLGDDEIGILPILRYDSERFSIGLPDGVRVTIYEDDGLRFSGLLTPRFSEVDSRDEDALDGIDREITADIGGRVDYTFGTGTGVFITALTELTDEHGGHEVTLGVRQVVPVGDMPVFFGAGLSWMSDDLSEYTYGVRSGDTGFAPYQPGDVVIPYISLGAAVPLNDRLNLVTNFQAEFLPEDVSDSPIVDDDVTFGALIGLSFQF